MIHSNVELYSRFLHLTSALLRPTLQSFALDRSFSYYMLINVKFLHYHYLGSYEIAGNNYVNVFLVDHEQLIRDHILVNEEERRKKQEEADEALVK